MLGREVRSFELSGDGLHVPYSDVSNHSIKGCTVMVLRRFYATVLGGCVMFRPGLSTRIHLRRSIFFGYDFHEYINALKTQMRWPPPAPCPWGKGVYSPPASRIVPTEKVLFSKTPRTSSRERRTSQHQVCLLTPLDSLFQYSRFCSLLPTVRWTCVWLFWPDIEPRGP